jgi:acetyl esterase/lipase
MGSWDGILYSDSWLLAPDLIFLDIYIPFLYTELGKGDIMKLKLFLSLLLILTTVRTFGQTYKVITDIPYTDSLISEKQKLDLYIPNIDNPMPCLVWIHGGAWLSGSKDGLTREIDTLLHHGYVVASIGYRLSGESIFPAQIYDCKAAIRFLKEKGTKYKIDSTKIAVAGSSAGGHLASLIGTSSNVPSLEDKDLGSKKASSKVHAVIDFYGPTDFLIMDELPDECQNPMVHLDPKSPESLLLGCNISNCPDKVKIANPITYITKDDPPFLIFHGTSDCIVTPKSSILLEEKLIEKGITTEIYLLKNAGHGGKEFESSEVKTLILNFLNKTLY